MAIAASVVAVIRKANWFRITAGVVGTVAGLIGMIDGFGTMGTVRGTATPPSERAWCSWRCWRS
ncbi:hypothetical protein [Streptomyces aureocirculatus]|uniref:hypothetical protein n=1 Tax=Streptomyces aureocirculatus TaxID=67275 RepID=UPI0012FEB5AF|nr:hypothetical protein [Streptomyces aureocirculatus]